MNSHEISLWIDERWYKALEQHLPDGSIEKPLNSYLDQLISQLPESVRDKINREIELEDQMNLAQKEAARRFAVLHVTENGNSIYFTAEERLDMLQAAVRLRSYTRKPPENSPSQFIEMFSSREKISREKFGIYVAEQTENTGRVTGVFDIDLDNGRFTALRNDGWQSFRIRDISTAAYFAMKKSGMSWDNRCRVFLDRLTDKEILNELEPGYIAGKRLLRADEVRFSEDIIQNDNLLEFCMDGAIDMDGLFGARVCDYDNGDWFNIYANYDMETRSVCDTLEVFLQHETGGEHDYKYRLTDEEKELLLPKMEEYCEHHWGQSLDECCQQYMTEQQEEQHDGGMTLG